MEKTISDQDKRKLCEQLIDKPLQVLTQLDGFADRDPFLDPTGSGVAITGCEAEEF